MSSSKKCAACSSPDAQWKCKGCKRVHYCSRKCQSVDWNLGMHANSCVMPAIGTRLGFDFGYGRNEEDILSDFNNPDKKDQFDYGSMWNAVATGDLDLVTAMAKDRDFIKRVFQDDKDSMYKLLKAALRTKQLKMFRFLWENAKLWDWVPYPSFMDTLKLAAMFDADEIVNFLVSTRALAIVSSDQKKPRRPV